jgi:hypothetical protein
LREIRIVFGKLLCGSKPKSPAYRPKVVALVGVTLYRTLLPLLGAAPAADVIGPQPVKIHGADVFVLPNPSGRNANLTYVEMLAFVILGDRLPG